MPAHNVPFALLALIVCASGSLAQPSDGLAGAVDPPPLILFSLQDPPRDHAPATISAQAARQAALLRALLDVKEPSPAQVERFHGLRGSLFSIARYVLNNESPGRDPALARALLPCVSEDMGRALAERAEALREPDGPYGARADTYDLARAIRWNLQRPDGSLERGLALDLARGLAGAIPWESGRTQRQFLTRFVLHELVRALWPALPTSSGHHFRDWVDLTRVEGEVGDWIDGLAGALTRTGRRKNTARLLARFDQLGT